MSDYPIFIDFFDAQRTVVDEAVVRRLPVDRVALSDAVGRVSQAPLFAREDHPPFDKSAMDGFAIVSDGMSIGDEFVIVGESQAGLPYAGRPISKKEAVRISTGAVIPDGADAVIPVEDTEESNDKFVAKSVVSVGRNVAKRGEDCKKGSVLLPAGSVVTPFVISALSSEGIEYIWVRRRPRIAIITTGDEVVSSDSDVSFGQIRNMNAPAMRSWIMLSNAQITFDAHVVDSTNDLERVISDALSNADVVLLSGGVSAGVHDLVPMVVQKLGGKIHFHKVKQKPGKPLLFATFLDKLFFGLPGNPVSSLIMLHVYVLPVLRIMQELPYRRIMYRAYVEEPVVFKGNRHRLELACVRKSYEKGLSIKFLPGAGSADVFRRVKANAFVSLPVSVQSLNEGDEVAFEFLSNFEGYV